MASTPNPSAIDLLLTSLKTELENKNEGAFERLSAHLLSPFLGDIAITVAKSGHQVGADGGTAGARGRRLSIECKRYKEATGLSLRHLAGELAEAVEADELLEAWILMATKAAKESERNLAFKLGQRAIFLATMPQHIGSKWMPSQTKLSEHQGFGTRYCDAETNFHL